MRQTGGINVRVLGSGYWLIPDFAPDFALTHGFGWSLKWCISHISALVRLR
ncbi:hypothetical protein BRAS3843_3500004 [Bradyrhizobium sp. STM 3843]|nr:hypothetical protein BRAS3843_3500004 [Bradyrhizobium sp. STM 3843]